MSFGAGATLVAGAQVSLVDLVLKSNAPGASLLNYNSSWITVEAASNPVAPIAYVIVPKTLGICDTLDLTAAIEAGGGGRPMNFSWSLVDFRAASAQAEKHKANVTTIIAASNTKNSGMGNPALSFPPTAIPGGTTLTFAITARNYGGMQARYLVTVTKLKRPAPRVLLDGAPIQHTFHGDEWVGRIYADLPVLSCVKQTLTADSMAFRWTELTGQYTGPALTPRNPRVLRLPPGSLKAKTNYTFEALIYMIEQPWFNNTVTVDVRVGVQRIQASLAMSGMSAGQAQPFTLDASGSFDPDERASGLTYEWTCERPGGNSSASSDAAATAAASAAADARPCLDLTGHAIDLPPGPTLTLPASTLPLGFYHFTVLVKVARRFISLQHTRILAKDWRE